MKKPKLTDSGEDGGIYFNRITAPTFPSGCTTLDLSLGGGWAEDRIANIVGDKSTGKTLLAIEAAANFIRKHPGGRVRYAECEAAFDRPYAESLGLPKKQVFIKEGLETVENLFEDLEITANNKSNKERPYLYIVDSLDALSDNAELGRKISDATFGGSKSKQMSGLFRRLTVRCARAHMSVIIISQVRDNLNATWGKKHTRSGGKALDFYASQVVWLNHTGRLSRERNGVKRVYGVDIKAVVEKNKIGPPFREAAFPIHFNYGVHDGIANLEWLIENKRHKPAFKSVEEAKATLKKLDTLPDAEFVRLNARVATAVREAWARIEDDFAPRRKKY